MAFNSVFPNGFKLNIVEPLSGVIHGMEHNAEGDEIVLVLYVGSHYTALIREG